MHHHRKQDEILTFWFGDEALQPLARQSIWFTKDAEVDQWMREHFQSMLGEALNGAYDDWSKVSRGALALVILCDQFPRNIYRDSDQAFAYDDRALRAAQIAIDHNFDRNMTVVERCFLYLPLEHSEDIAIQERSVQLFSTLSDTATGEEKVFIQSALDYALKHRDIIAKFGRFPHRNEILGRASTRAEIEFLKRPGSYF
jgi:uncharacterized protein (DUF924 family)